MIPLSLYKHLVSTERLEMLIKLLLEKETLKRNIRVKDFGPRVITLDEAQSIFEKIIRCTWEVLDVEKINYQNPKLMLTNRLSRLPRETLKSYLFFIPLSLILSYFAIIQSFESPIIYIVYGAILTLLIIPLIIYRRTSLHLQHQCSYERTDRGEATIIIEQLPLIQFHSYLAHEYAHHVYFFLGIQTGETQTREGWARFVQWLVMNHLYNLEGNSAYLYHALLQIIGELKFACQFIAMSLQKKLPRKVRRIPTMYQPNPLYNLLTGTPGFSEFNLLKHAIGTASYFLAQQKVGFRKVLHHDDSERTSWPF